MSSMRKRSRSQSSKRYTSSGKKYRPGYSGSANPRLAQPNQRTMSVQRGIDSSTELKSVDGVFTSAINADGKTQMLNIIKVGSAFYERVGNRINMKSLEIRWVVAPTYSAPTTATTEWLRFLIVYDKQSNGAEPTWADVITSYNNAGTTTSLSTSFMNINNRDRFVMISDKQFALADSDVDSNVATDSVVDYRANPVNYHRYIKLKGLPVVYKGSAGSSGDISTGGLLFMILGVQAAGQEAFAVRMSWRLRYTDA